MEKFFQAIKRLRPAVQAGKTSREDALKILMQESGVSEDVAETAVKNMVGAQPEVPGGITSLKPDVTFSSTQKKLPDPIDMSVEERTGGMLKEGKEGEYTSTMNQESGAVNVDPSIMTLGDEDAFKYEMAQYRQRRERKMQPVYKKYGAVTERDRSLVDEYVSIDSEDNIILSSSNPKYDKATASIFIQESAEEAAGQAGADIAANVLYSRPAENILVDEGLDAYIDYAFNELKKEGLSFNKNLLKRVLKEKYAAKDIPDGFANGGRIGFAEGVGRKGILSALVDKLNEISPGSTAVGKTTKAISDKAKRAEAERELIEGFNRFNKDYPKEYYSVKKGEGTEIGTQIVDEKTHQELVAGFNNKLSELEKPEPSVKIIEKEAPDATNAEKLYDEYIFYRDEEKNFTGSFEDFIKERRNAGSYTAEMIEPNYREILKLDPVKAGQGKFTAAEILLERLKNTLKNEKDPYVQETFPNFIKEIEANPKLANDPKVQEAFGLRDLPENQRLVEYDDGTFDFFTKGQKRGLGSAKALADEFGISMEEAVNIQMMEPEDQVLEIQRRRTLNKRNLNASGGLNYLMGM